MKKGSATLVIIISAIVTLLYATSTNSDVIELKKTFDKYQPKIMEQYEIKLNEKLINY